MKNYKYETVESAISTFEYLFDDRLPRWIDSGNTNMVKQTLYQWASSQHMLFNISDNLYAELKNFDYIEYKNTKYFTQE